MALVLVCDTYAAEAFSRISAPNFLQLYQIVSGMPRLKSLPLRRAPVNNTGSTQYRGALLRADGTPITQDYMWGGGGKLAGKGFSL